MKRLHLIVQGKVQGIGFRSATKAAADALGLTGLVRNGAEGTVEIIAEGADSALARLLEWAEQGPERAEVAAVEHHWRQPTGAYTDFQVVP